MPRKLSSSREGESQWSNQTHREASSRRGNGIHDFVIHERLLSEKLQQRDAKQREEKKIIATSIKKYFLTPEGYESLQKKKQEHNDLIADHNVSASNKIKSRKIVNYINKAEKEYEKRSRDLRTGFR